MYKTYYTVLIYKQDYVDLQQIPDIHVISKRASDIDGELYVVKIESLADVDANVYQDLLQDDIILAVHEELTNSIITTKTNITLLAESYSWETSGYNLIGDMLTARERMYEIVMHIYNVTKKSVQINGLEYKEYKATESHKLADIEDLFTNNNISEVTYEDETVQLWWPTILEDSKRYITIIDEKAVIDDDPFGLFDIDDDEEEYYYRHGGYYEF